VNLALEPGDRVAVLGESGTGKTTLLHALAGLLRPLAGEVVADEATVASASTAGTSRHAAYMFQRDLLLPWKTARENVTTAAAAARPRDRRTRPNEFRAELRLRAEALLTEFGLGEVLHYYPHQLSGGMRQRVALARTLLLGRGLILLDEPFAGLDSLTRADLQDWISDVMAAHPATWVLVTHDIHEAVALCDRVAVLGGRPARITGWVDTSKTGGREQTLGELRDLLMEARPRAGAEMSAGY
jgi:ABC-type nitrate/sulfonate/bicarbonate transport system ATPase subunit